MVQFLWYTQIAIQFHESYWGTVDLTIKVYSLLEFQEGLERKRTPFLVKFSMTPWLQNEPKKALAENQQALRDECPQNEELPGCHWPWLYSKSPRPGVVGPLPNGHEHGGYKWRWPSPNYLHPLGADPPSRIQYFRWSQALRAQWYDIYKAGKPHSFFSHNKRRHSTKIRGQSGTLKEKTPEQRERVAGRGGCFLWSMAWSVGWKAQPNSYGLCGWCFFLPSSAKKLLLGDNFYSFDQKKTPWNKTKKSRLLSVNISVSANSLEEVFRFNPFFTPSNAHKNAENQSSDFSR